MIPITKIKHTKPFQLIKHKQLIQQIACFSYLSLTSCLSFADAPTDEKTNPISTETANTSGWWNLNGWDKIHTQWNQKLYDSALEFDRFFGDETQKSTNGEIRSFLNITQSAQINENDPGVKYNISVRGRYRLPATEEKLQLLFFNSDNENNTTDANRNDSFNQLANDQGSSSTALRWMALYAPNYQIDFDVGARLNKTLDGFAQLWARRSWTLSDKDQAHFTQNIFFRNSIGFGEYTQIALHHQLSPDQELRWISRATFSEESLGVNWFHDASFYHRLTDQSALAWIAYVEGHTEPSYTTQLVSLKTRYRHNIFRPWLFVELEPQLNFPREDSFNLTPAIILRIETQFDSKTLNIENGP